MNIDVIIKKLEDSYFISLEIYSLPKDYKFNINLNKDSKVICILEDVIVVFSELDKIIKGDKKIKIEFNRVKSLYNSSIIRNMFLKKSTEEILDYLLEF